MRELQARVAALFRRPRTSDLVSPSTAAATAQAAEAVALAVVDPATDPATGEAYAPTDPLGCDDLTLKPGAREVLVSGEEIDLTRTEFDLLAHLVRNPGVVVAREDLMRAVWATDFVPDSTHVVDVHLANLRRKLRSAASGNEWIRTIRGVGFRFDPCCP